MQSLHIYRKDQVKESEKQSVREGDRGEKRIGSKDRSLCPAGKHHRSRLSLRPSNQLQSNEMLINARTTTGNHATTGMCVSLD